MNRIEAALSSVQWMILTLGVPMSRSAAHSTVDISRPYEGFRSSANPPSPGTHAVSSDHRLRMPANNQDPAEKNGRAFVEILNSSELALRLKVKESWVIEQSKRSRTADPIPVLRLGKHRRYRWGSPEMNDWLARRAGCTTTSRKAWS